MKLTKEQCDLLRVHGFKWLKNACTDRVESSYIEAVTATAGGFTVTYRSDLPLVCTRATVDSVEWPADPANSWIMVRWSALDDTRRYDAAAPDNAAPDNAAPDNARSLQIWPRGDCVDYAEFKAGYVVKRDGVWTQADDAMVKAIEIALHAERILDNEVFCCDSMLVDALFKAEFPGFNYDGVENLVPDPADWDYAECVQYLRDNGFDDEANELDDEDEDAARDAVSEAATDSIEIYEWWRVSSWLCRQLREIGEPVLDNDYGYWYGRRTMGQALIMDGVLQNVAARHRDSC